MPPVVKGESSASTALPSKALATGAPSRSATSVHLGARVQRALSNQDRDLAPAVQDVGGGAQLIARWLVDHGHPRRRRSCARIAHRALVCRQTHHLGVLRHGEMSDSPIAKRYATGPVRHQHSVFRSGHFDIIQGHVLHELRRVDALLVARSDQVMKGHARDRDNRRAIHVCVVKTVEKVDGAGTRGADTHAQLTCVFREA
jgi:hypothetical protein